MPPANPTTYKPRQFQARGHVLTKAERAALEVPGGWTNFLLSRNEELALSMVEIELRHHLRDRQLCVDC